MIVLFSGFTLLPFHNYKYTLYFSPRNYQIAYFLNANKLCSSVSKIVFTLRGK